jgi:hypothetical protein
VWIVLLGRVRGEREREREGGREGGGDFVESITRLSFRAGNKSEIIKRSENNRNQSCLLA